MCVWDTKLLFFEGSLDFITLSLYNFFNYLLFLLYKTIDTNDVLFFSFPFLLSLETITHEQYLNT